MIPFAELAKQILSSFEQTEKNPVIKEKNEWEEKYNLLVHEIYHEQLKAQLLFDDAKRGEFFSANIIKTEGQLRCLNNILDIVSRINKSYSKND